MVCRKGRNVDGANRGSVHPRTTDGVATGDAPMRHLAKRVEKQCPSTPFERPLECRPLFYLNHEGKCDRLFQTSISGSSAFRIND